MYFRYPFARVISEDFLQNGTHLLDEPIVRAVLANLTLGVPKRLTPQVPVYMYHGLHDEVIPYRDAHKTAQMWGKHGADVLLHTDTFPALGHAATELANLPNLLFFIQDRFADKPFPTGFHNRRVWNPLDSKRAKEQGLKSVVEIIRNIFGDKIGPKRARKLAVKARRRDSTCNDVEALGIGIQGWVHHCLARPRQN